jgi:indolepyruvate ferredoxin oxidoreductase beta subunit
MAGTVTNVVFAGLGGQGVLRASDILSEAAFRAGRDVKKSEIHGMSQRGGFVTSDVRFGTEVLSPMIPAGEADVLVLLAMDQKEAAAGILRPDGTLLAAEAIDEDALPERRALNVAMLGLLSGALDLDEAAWHDAIRAHFPDEALFAANEAAFALGRDAAR